MNSSELLTELMSLPAAQRLEIAQKVWASLEDVDLPTSGDSASETLPVARKRDAEMSAGSVEARDHDDVMEHAQRSIHCE